MSMDSLVARRLELDLRDEPFRPFAFVTALLQRDEEMNAMADELQAPAPRRQMK
jgi:hypothetical protein